MMSVPRHDPRILAGASVRRRSCHVHGLGDRLGRHNDLGDHHHFLFPVHFLNTEHSEPEAPPADILDASEPGHKDVPDAENLGQYVFVVHADLHNAPREDRLLATYETIFASVSRSVLTHVETRGFQRVNGAVA